jgi:signal transduction histidine kinase
MIFDDNERPESQNADDSQTKGNEQDTEELAAKITHIRHEINNALTGILGQSQLLLREELDEKSRNRVATIQQLANRIRELISGLGGG